MNATDREVARDSRVAVAGQVWHDVHSRSRLFLAQPQMHELVARCSADDCAANLAAQDAARHAGPAGQASVVTGEDVDARD